MKPLFAQSEPSTQVDSFQTLLDKPPATKTVDTPVKQSVPAILVTDLDVDRLGENNASRIAATTKKILENVRASDTEGMGVKLNELVGQAKKLDPKKLAAPSMISKLFGFGGSIKEKLMAEYATVETQMSRLSTDLDQMAALMKQRVDDCDSLFEENFQTYQSLQRDIASGEQMIGAIDAQLANTSTPTDGFGAQSVADLQARANRLRKRVDDFQRGMQLALMAAPEIRMQQQHCRSLVNSVRDIKVTTLPAWQGVFSRYVLALEAKKGAEIVNAVYDATDAAFRLQADQLRTNTQQIAKAQERSVVTVETLEHMQTQLLGALDDAQQIAKEGQAAREAAKPKLQQLEAGLIQRFSPSLITK